MELVVRRREVPNQVETSIPGDNMSDTFDENGQEVTISFPVDQSAPTTPTVSAALTREEALRLVEDARKEEKDKLYPQMEELQKTVRELQTDRDARQKSEQQAQQQAAEADRLRLEAEQTAVERLETQQREMELRLDSLRREAETERALREKESEYAQVAQYRYERLQQESDAIAPQLVDYVVGSTVEEVEQSIEIAKAKTNQILAELQNAQVNQQRAVAPPVTGMPPVDEPNNISGERQMTLTPEDIRSMTVEEYSQYRSQLLGAASGKVRSDGMYSR